MEKTLLERAKDVTNPTKFRNSTIEEFELAVAYVNREVSANAVAKIIGFKSSGNTGHWVTAVIREGVRQNKINVKLLKND